MTHFGEKIIIQQKNQRKLAIGRQANCCERDAGPEKEKHHSICIERDRAMNYRMDARVQSPTQFECTIQLEMN